MRKNKFPIVLVILILLISSCEKTYQIGGSFVSEFNREPIVGLEVGLYQMVDSFTVNSTWDDLTLLQSTRTDSSGCFFFEVTEEQNFGCMYLPIPSKDPNSVNVKHVLSDENIDIVDWSKTRLCTLKPSILAHLTFDKMQITKSMELRFENQVSMGMTVDGNPVFQLYMTPGEPHVIGLYDSSNGHELWVRDFTVQIEPKVNFEDKLHWIQPMVVEVKLENN